MPVQPSRGSAHTAPEARPGYLIGRIDRIIRRSYEATLERHDLTLAQYTVLSVMAAQPGLSSAQLARRSLVSPQGMNNIVNDLEGKGLIERTPHEAGGRVLRASVSELGARVLSDCDTAVQSIEDTLFSALDGDERARFVSALQVLAGISAPADSPCPARPAEDGDELTEHHVGTAGRG